MHMYTHMYDDDDDVCMFVAQRPAVCKYNYVCMFVAQRPAVCLSICLYMYMYMYVYVM